MTDQDENRPLSRRELRLREMAAAGLQSESAQANLDADQAASEAAESEELDFQVEIPLFDENGNPRSRRELRELREQAVAELKAANADMAVEEPLSELGFNPELAETVAFDVLADITEDSETGQSAETSEPDVISVSEDNAFDALLQQVTSDEAEHSGSIAEDHDVSFEDAPAEADFAVILEPEVEVLAEPQPDPESELERDEVQVELEVAPTEDSPEAEKDTTLGSGGVFSAPVSASTGQSYSFPDITPLDDGQSIFDDPAIQVIGGATESAGSDLDTGHDFDELITRAVAQEGAASTTNTSALILPVMPETDALSGPLGETGELFITGSFDLPKSLSETGGHASLHDSIDAEPFDDLGFVEPTPTGAMAPVSASRAVSARANQGPLVAEATRDKSRMPVVLIATGGVLVLGATGLIIWAATSGLFG